MNYFRRATLPSLLTALVVILVVILGSRAGYAQETRFALVIGNDEYKTGKLATPANDAGLIADALQTAGFTVTGARNLDQATLRESFREFLDQVNGAGPGAVAMVYLAGYGLQFQGENYFVPVDADIHRDSDIPLQAIRVSDLTQPLAGLPGRVKIFVLDAARQNPFQGGDQPLASGLALVEPIHSMAIAFNAAPGTVAPDEPGPYGAYASAFTEMISAGGLDLDNLFSWLRLRVSDVTKGAEVPWSVSQIDGPFYMTERAADAPPPPNVMPVAEVRNKPIRDFTGVDDAYAAALERDSIDGYEQFLAIYPNSPYAARVAAMIAVRREEIIWRRAVMADTPPAYWSYLRRYPDGPHVWDARRRLEMLAAAFEPPPDFAYYDFGVPPPPPDELIYFRERPVFMFVGPRFAPPPPPPLFFLPPRPHEFAVLPPPPPPRERFGLPIPAAAVVPAFVRPPRTVEFRAAPPGQGGPGTGPGGRPPVRISLPTAIERRGAPQGTPGGAPSIRPGINGPATQLPHVGPGGPPPPAPPPSGAFVRPGAPPPPLPAPPGGERERSTFRPAPPPPSPPGGQSQPSTVKPATPPPPPPATRIRPGVVRPAPPPSPPPGQPRERSTFKPAPPPPPPPGQARQRSTFKPAPPPPPQARPQPPPPPRPQPPAPAVSRPPPPHPAAPPAPRPGPACPPGKRPTPQGCK